MFAQSLWSVVSRINIYFPHFKTNKKCIIRRIDHCTEKQSFKLKNNKFCRFCFIKKFKKLSPKINNSSSIQIKFCLPFKNLEHLNSKKSKGQEWIINIRI